MAADDDSKSRRSRGGTFGVWSVLFCGALALTALLDTFFFADVLPSLGDGDAGDAASGDAVSAPAEDVVATLEAELAAETRKRDVVVEKLARETAAAARSAAAAAREVPRRLGRGPPRVGPTRAWSGRASRGPAARERFWTTTSSAATAGTTGGTSSRGRIPRSNARRPKGRRRTTPTRRSNI